MDNNLKGSNVSGALSIRNQPGDLVAYSLEFQIICSNQDFCPKNVEDEAKTDLETPENTEEEALPESEKDNDGETIDPVKFSPYYFITDLRTNIKTEVRDFEGEVVYPMGKKILG